MPNGEVPPIGSRQSRIRPPAPASSIMQPRADAHTFACCAPAASCVLPSFFQRELPLLTWPHLAQRPLRSAEIQLETASFPRRSASASLPCSRAAACVASQAKTCAAYSTPGSIPAHADPSAAACRLGMASKALQMCLFYASPAVLAEHATSDPTCPVSHGPQHLSCRFLLLRACTSCSETQMPYPTFHIPIPIPLPN